MLLVSGIRILGVFDKQFHRKSPLLIADLLSKRSWRMVRVLDCQRNWSPFRPQ